MAKREELVVITKAYELVLWSCNHTSRFPRNHRFVLGERIERGLYELLETLIRAKYRRERTSLLDTANLKLELLRFQFRLAKDLQCFKLNSYEFVTKAVDEIGRLIGGWQSAPGPTFASSFRRSIDQVHAAGEREFEIRPRVIARSRATSCSQPIGELVRHWSRISTTRQQTARDAATSFDRPNGRVAATCRTP